ncbi:YgcG family protein [Leptospira sp. WS39.C2]
MSRILVFFFFVIPVFLSAKDVPILKTRVLDETWTLHTDFVSALEKQLKDHEKKTSNQIVVYLTPSLEGENIEEYSIRVAEAWKLGQKGKDNGVLLLIAKDDRKLKIEVGYGLEGNLTDILCRHIIENEIKPYFKKGEFDKGIQNGVNRIMSAIEGEYQMPVPKDYSHLGPLSFLGELSYGSEHMPIGLKIFLSIFIVVVLGIFTYFATITPYIGWFVYFFLFPFWTLFPTAIHGANVGSAVFLTYAIGIGLYKLYLLITPQGRKRMKRYGVSIGSGNGSGSRSSGWSSSGSSGSFRGGGGSFGGGGSSGSW